MGLFDFRVTVPMVSWQVSKKSLILLIQPPVKDFYITSKRTFPYGLASIASSVMGAGYKVQIFDALASPKSKTEEIPPELSYLETFYGKPDLSPFALFHKFKRFGYSFEHVEKIAKESRAGIVGISSLFTAYSNEALETAVSVKKSLPGCVVVMGGHHPTELPEKVMECPAVDFILRGEGEESFPALVEKLRKQEDYRSVPGIVYRKRDGGLAINPPIIVKDPDNFPLPAIGLIKNSWYQIRKRRTTVVTASRGCPMKCSYCSMPNSFNKYRRKSVKKVMEEIDYAVENHNVGFIDFEDENISLDRIWFQKLLRQIINRHAAKEIELRAMNGLYPPSLDISTLKLMKSAGFKTLNLSVGSTSVRRLKKFCRPDVTQDLDRIILDAKKCGLNCVCYVIAGGPGQTAEESLADLIYLFQRPVLIGLSIFYPSPGSVDYSVLKSCGLLPESLSMLRSSAIPAAGKASRLELATLMRLSRILNFIKFLESQKKSIPSASKCDESLIHKSLERDEIGRKLLSWMLSDAHIRGVGTEGEIYEHAISMKLAKKFLYLLNGVRPR